MSVTATDVLGALFNPVDTVCFRVFDDKKDGIFKGAKLTCECGKYKSVEETLKNHNAMNRGVFYVVNYGGHDDESISRINAQFVEMDSGSFEEQQKKGRCFSVSSVHDYENAEISARVLVYGQYGKGGALPYDSDPACEALCG